MRVLTLNELMRMTRGRVPTRSRQLWRNPESLDFRIARGQRPRDFDNAHHQSNSRQQIIPMDDLRRAEHFPVDLNREGFTKL